jgi:CMP-N-acetylneuraminic acid synthetase
MKIVTVILARGGSKGIPKKNIIDVNGLPLIAYTINASIGSKTLETWVSTNCEDIASISEHYGANILWRPAELATDTASSESALLHFAENIDFDILVFIQPTSPLLESKYINEGLSKMNKYDSIVSVYEEKWSAKFDEDGNPHGWDMNNRPRRQEAKKIYVDNGAFFITTKEALIKSGRRYSGNIGMVEMPFSKSFEIDTIDELNLIRKIL